MRGRTPRWSTSRSSRSSSSARPSSCSSCLNYIVNATKIGKAIRSVAQDRNTAALMGIGVNAIISFTFLLGGALGGAAGLLYALKFTRIDPFVGFMPGIKAFTAAVLGGIGNLTGALLGGIILGMLESFAGRLPRHFHAGRLRVRIQGHHRLPGADRLHHLPSLGPARRAGLAEGLGGSAMKAKKPCASRTLSRSLRSFGAA